MLHAQTFLFLIGGIILCSAEEKTSTEWWRNNFIYQIYPLSFKDSTGDGVGDLNGITSKLEHIADIGASALWISPIYVSPMVDFGYDITNFTDIDPVFGNLDDFSKLVTKAKSLGLKVLLDFVPNHSSDKCSWFTKSIQKIKPYDEYYIWKDAKIVNGTRQPPNNWLGAFQGSAWEWNEQRQQYYYHAFAVGQPDLNYRNPQLNEEMKNVLRFWLNRGVDGFRVDAIHYLIEDSRFLDEPKIANTGLPDTDAGTLEHIYTCNQKTTYDIVKTWRDVLDASPGPKKVFLTEAYTSIDYLMEYYKYGSNLPMNFMFMEDLRANSTALEFKYKIDRYLNRIPNGQSANWVVGNHDKFRVATRFGPKRADQLTMIATILPGVAIIYNGDEIGMENNIISWEETVDPAGCNAGPERYNTTSRDPARTPFQWDDTVSAGFSTNTKTWLPIHPNYKTLNLAAQKLAPASHYKVLKKLSALKKYPAVKDGSTEIIVVGYNVLGIVRRLPGKSHVVLLINFNDSMTVVDAASWMNIPDKMNVYTASVHSNIQVGESINTNEINLPPAASVILT
ncbi:alpha-glucosidase-like [Aphidius gifuensis]|uniref:alpha-glucosidase-like n=1 Tax=Aphidius gifuensis TaxID=684658 RepID=UPI001CDB5F62|nr:alpha-glucosidase-like [Aphidius gifuensis]